MTEYYITPTNFDIAAVTIFPCITMYTSVKSGKKGFNVQRTAFNFFKNTDNNNE